MSEIHDVLYPPKEQDTRVSHRRYDSKERLAAWIVLHGDHFLVFRVDSFREVTLAYGETLDVPETIQCRFSEHEIEPNAAFADECSVSYGADSTSDYIWAGREVDDETQLQYARSRCYDRAVGRWISVAPLGHEPAATDFFPYVKQA